MPTAVWTVEPGATTGSSDTITYEGETLTEIFDKLFPVSVYRLIDYLHPDDLFAAYLGDTASQNETRVTAAVQAFHDRVMAWWNGANSRNLLRRAVSNPSGIALSTNGSSAGANTALIIPNSSCAMFHGTVIAGGTTGVNASWTVTGIVQRGASAATTVVKGVTVTNTYADAGAATWTIAAVADTSLGGLSITTTGTGSYTVLADVTLTEIQF